MRGSLRVMLLCLGLLMVAAGTAIALFVGPDDTLQIGEKQVPERAAGVAVRTHPGITDFVNIDMLVRAKADGGVFLGTSHRVDTESLLVGKRYFEITRMALGDVGGVYTEGAPRATRKALRPARLVGWLDSDTDGEQAELLVPLDGEPIDIIAVPDRGNARVTISIGAHVTGLFFSQVAVALTGVVMVGLSFAVGWWLRRKESARPESTEDDDEDDEDGPDGGRTGGASDAERPWPRLPLSLPRHPGGEGRIADSPQDRASQNRSPQNCAPQNQVAPRWSRGRIALILVLVPLALTLTSCAVPGPADESDGERKETRTGMSLPEAQTVVPDAAQVYADEFETYPMWSLVALEKPQRLRVLTRDAFASPWRTEAGLRVGGELPEPVGRAIPAGKILLERAERAAASISTWWSTGEPSALKPDRRTRAARARLLASGVSPSAIWVLDPPPGTPRVRVVEVTRGHLVVVRHTVLTPEPRSLTTVILFPSTEAATVLGSSLVDIG